MDELIKKSTISDIGFEIFGIRTLCKEKTDDYESVIDSIFDDFKPVIEMFYNKESFKKEIMGRI